MTVATELAVVDSVSQAKTNTRSSRISDELILRYLKVNEEDERDAPRSLRTLRYTIEERGHASFIAVAVNFVFLDKVSQ